MELREIFVSNMKRYRKDSKLSQMSLAERCDTSTSYIGEIEIGKKFPSVEMIQKIAAALEVQPFQLFMQESDICAQNGVSLERRAVLVQKIQRAVADIIDEEL